jgi:dTDP-4-dehydrorhamnose 3,5-epimerase
VLLITKKYTISKEQYMEKIQTNIEGLYLVKHKVFRDERGFLKFKESGIDLNFVQDNYSRSHKHVIRGLHAQKGQAKLVGVTHGTILDVAVDIREGSNSFGKVYSTELSYDSGLLLCIPDGFLHGFQVISDEASVFYKVSSIYNPSEEFGVNPLDKDLAINWPNKKDAIINTRDLAFPNLYQLGLNLNNN